MTGERRVLRIGHSPDPDDAFMFFGLAHGLVRIRDFEVEHVLEEIESLNRRALAGELEVTAISARAYAEVADRYWILSTGASVGRGYGPVVVARSPLRVDDLSGAEVGLPGPMTTAALLARFYLPRARFRHLPFDAIVAAVQEGAVLAGVLIHEGQLTHAEHGLAKVLDLGERWHADEGLPIPLGLDVVRKDLGADLAREIDAALRASIRCAFEREVEALDDALRFGRGIPPDVGRRFVRMYVNDDTLRLPPDGRRALERLFARAVEARLIPRAPRVEFVPGT